MKKPSVPLVIACALLGAFVDFLCNGVLKIVWIVIYGPAYVAAAKVLSIQLGKTRFKESVNAGVIALIAGAAAGHLLLVGRSGQLTYPMRLTNRSPIMLNSADWPQILIVASDKLHTRLESATETESIPVVVDTVSDYGCFRSHVVSTVDGIDVNRDRDASWTWKDPGLPLHPSETGPALEDQFWPWCRFKFYRGVQK